MNLETAVFLQVSHQSIFKILAPRCRVYVPDEVVDFACPNFIVRVSDWGVRWISSERVGADAQAEGLTITVELDEVGHCWADSQEDSTVGGVLLDPHSEFSSSIETGEAGEWTRLLGQDKTRRICQ